MAKKTAEKIILEGVGEKVKQYRYDKRLTLDELADKAKVSTVLLSQIEKGYLKNTSLKKLAGVAAAIECNLKIELTPIGE